MLGLPACDTQTHTNTGVRDARAACMDKFSHGNTHTHKHAHICIHRHTHTQLTYALSLACVGMRSDIVSELCMCVASESMGGMDSVLAWVPWCSYLLVP